MARPKLYHTAEEKKAADRRRAQRWLDKPGNKERLYQSSKISQSSRYRRWQQAHPEKVRLKSATERAIRLQRIPPWANLKVIEIFYLNCPRGHHVDHIVPLRGILVSGLHVENNLQYLTEIDNLSKGNKFEV